jgi:hypothetical protein
MTSTRTPIAPRKAPEGPTSTRKRLEQEHDLVTRRLAALTLAVRQHEQADRGRITGISRPHDRRLYRRVRQICGER